MRLLETSLFSHYEMVTRFITFTYDIKIILIIISHLSPSLLLHPENISH